MSTNSIDHKKKYESKLVYYHKLKNQLKGGGFHVGDTVFVNGSEEYGAKTNYSGKIGTVVGIRHRYRGTPYEYYQYQVHINGHFFPVPDSLDFMFDEHSLKPIHLETDVTRYASQKGPEPANRFNVGERVRFIDGTHNEFAAENYLGQIGVISNFPIGKFYIFDTEYKQNMYGVKFNDGQILEIFENNLERAHDLPSSKQPRVSEPTNRFNVGDVVYIKENMGLREFTDRTKQRIIGKDILLKNTECQIQEVLSSLPSGEQMYDIMCDEKIYIEINHDNLVFL